MKKPLLTLGRVVLTLLVVAFACVVVWRMTMYYMFAPWTRDGHIRADVVQIAPDVSGLIKQVEVRDNQPVTRDQVLFVIDQERFKLALRQAQATVADRKETLAQAQRESRRNKGLGIWSRVSNWKKASPAKCAPKRPSPKLKWPWTVPSSTWTAPWCAARWTAMSTTARHGSMSS